TWEREKVRRQLSFFEQYSDVVLVYTGRIVIGGPRGRVLYRVPANRSGFVDRDLLVDNFVGMTSGVAMSSVAFWKAGGFDPDQPARQDYDLWLRIAPMGRVVADGEYGLRYRLADGNADNVSRGNIQKHVNAIQRLKE